MRCCCWAGLGQAGWWKKDLGCCLNIDGKTTRTGRTGKIAASERNFGTSN